MVLSDPSYLGFFAVILVLFYLLPAGTARVALLLIASVGFYFNLSGVYIAVLLFVATIAYAGGLLLQAHAKSRHCRALFITTLLAVITPLILFKYLAFLCEAVGLAVPAPVAQLALPIGLSFYTFVAIGYLIDIHLDVLAAERNPLRLGLLIAFFPLVTAGPIERGGRLLPQLDLALPFSSERAFTALRLIFVGLVLKVLIADTLAVPVSIVFGEPQNSPPLEKFAAIVFFAFDLYADFAGYSLIAIGCARMLGIDIQPNFRQPFLSTTIPEFWRTWHMSLSFWVRDYLFLPLRAHWRRTGNKGIVASTLLSFLILGIWHGAGWPFVILGVAFGVLATASIFTLKYRDAAYAALRVPRPVVRVVRTVITFVLVALVLVLFRANFLDDAMLFYRDIFSLEMLSNVWDVSRFALFGAGTPPDLPVASTYAVDWLLIVAVIAGDILVRNGVTLPRCPVPVQVAAYNSGLLLIVYQWAAGSVPLPFLYYKF